MKRFFIEKEKQNNQTVIIEGEEFHHMTNVLRLNQGDEIEICFNDGMIHSAILEEINKKFARANIVESKESRAEAKIEVVLFQALPKGEKMDWIVQKATELGITSIVPFESRFTVAKIGAASERLQKIAVQSSKQCGRAVVLKVITPLKFKEMIAMLNQYDIVLFANETEQEQGFFSLKEYDGKRVAIIVGSEGGFASEEIEQIVALQNVHSISLGNRILRCETAAITLAGIVMHELGELRRK